MRNAVRQFGYLLLLLALHCIGEGCSSLHPCRDDDVCQTPCKSETPPCPPKAEAPPAAQPQRVIVEVRQQQAPAQSPAAMAPAPQPQFQQPMLMQQAYAPQQQQMLAATASFAPQAVVGAARPGLTFDFFRLPIPFLRFVAVQTAPEVAMVQAQPMMMQPQMMMQQPVYAPPPQPVLMQAPPPPQQMAVVPVRGEALVPVGGQGVAVGVCPPAAPALDPKDVEAFRAQVEALKAALEAQRKQ